MKQGDGSLASGRMGLGPDCSIIRSAILSRKGYTSQALHGDIPQVSRLKTMQQFKQGDHCQTLYGGLI